MDDAFIKAAEEISSRFQRLEDEHDRAAIEVFKVLEGFDPETAALAIEALGDRDNAALWFTDHIGSLAGETPWEYLAKGDVERVRWVLNAILYSIY